MSGPADDQLNQMIRKAWQRARSSREPWKLARPIASDLAPVLSGVGQLIEKDQPAVAERVLREFVKAADRGLAHVDDSNGYLGPLCQAAVALWGKAWAKIEPRDPKKLAELVFEGVQNNGYAVRDHMIRDFSQALGRDGLLLLKEMFSAELQSNLVDKTIEDWKRNQPLRHLAEVADALGDVEMYINVQQQNKTVDIYATGIARRLLDAGRAAEALEYLGRADPARSSFHDEVNDYPTLKCKILQALGRDDDARDTLWQEFRRSLSESALDHLLTLTPSGQQQALRDKAIRAAEDHANRLSAAAFLLKRDCIDRAAKLVDRYPDQFSGWSYASLLELAEAFDEKFPASAWILYRSLLLNILEQKRSKAYRHATDYLNIANGLAVRAGLQEKQRELLEMLQQQHGRKYAFWSLIKA